MLSYQHGYHAGNPADVHKHLTLLAVTQYLLNKPAAIHFFDTHAGKGLYDLNDAQAQKKQEYRAGVLETLASRQALISFAPWQHYFQELDKLHQGKVTAENLACYPGSPYWLSSLCREQDRLTVFELHPQEHQALAALDKNHRGMVVQGDGLQGVVSCLPAKTPRLFVLIDPAYEMASEYIDVAATVAAILKKSRHAVVLVWYPLLAAEKHQALCQAISQGLDTPVLQSEWIYKEKPSEWGMYGSGMLVVNPPWQLEVQLQELLQPLQVALGKAAQHKIALFNTSLK